MAFYMEIMTPSGSAKHINNQAISSPNPQASPRVFDDKPALGRSPAKTHNGFTSNGAAVAEATQPPLPVKSFLLWVTCQGADEPNLPEYEPSDESREPLNKYMLATPTTTKPFERRNGLNGILHSPRAVTPREKRDTTVRWRDHEVSMESTMFRNTLCGGRSALADVVDDSARMKRTPSIPLKRQPTPLTVACISHPLSPPSQRQNRTLFSNPLSPPPSPSNFEKSDPILAFREIKLDSQPRKESVRHEQGLYNDQGLKVVSSSKLVRSPSPHPIRLTKAYIQGSQTEAREEPQLARARKRPEREQPSLASSPITTTSAPKTSVKSPTVTKPVPKKPATTNYAEIVWKSKGSEYLKKEKSSQKASKIVAMINGSRKQASTSAQGSTAISGQGSSAGSTPRYKMTEYTPSAPTYYIPTAASYD
jgi:hypothetical protein